MNHYAQLQALLKEAIALGNDECCDLALARADLYEFLDKYPIVGKLAILITAAHISIRTQEATNQAQ